IKGTGPTESLRKIPKLTPQLSRFVEGMGVYFESQGIPRIGGRMLGLLMIAHWPLSAEDIAGILRVSRGSISTNLRLLLSSGMVEKAPSPRSRTTYYAFSDEAMEHRLTASVKSVQAFKRLLQQAAGATPARDPARHHIDDSLAVSDLMLEAFQQVAKRLHARRPAHAHLHAGPDGD
ncbi:MAG: hypothetical protein V1755_06225, partial [Chloroflexota bacterium]